MEGIHITENPGSLVLLVDKSVYSKSQVAHALQWLRQTEELDTSHLGEIDSREQTELEILLGSMTEEDREIGFIHESTL